jgi:hypothetical protein
MSAVVTNERVGRFVIGHGDVAVGAFGCFATLRTLQDGRIATAVLEEDYLFVLREFLAYFID